MLKILMEKVDNMQEQMDNVSRKVEILRKQNKTKQKRQRSKTVIELKNAFDGLISRLDPAEKRISELEDMSVETFKTKKQREKRLGKEMEKTTQELWDNYKRCNICIIGILEGEERKEQKKYLK